MFPLMSLVFNESGRKIVQKNKLSSMQNDISRTAGAICELTVFNLLVCTSARKG